MNSIVERKLRSVRETILVSRTEHTLIVLLEFECSNVRYMRYCRLMHQIGTPSNLLSTALILLRVCVAQRTQSMGATDATTHSIHIAGYGHSI